MNRETVDLYGQVKQLCEYFEGMAEERELQLVNHVEGCLQVDPQLLRRALANLLANALRHATPGSAVTVASQLRDGRLEVSVHNLGEPIGAEHLPRLFERFYRCDPSRARPGDPGGLGLAIVRSIMQLHGGSVRVESGEQGTRFILVFPLAERSHRKR
ncbi:Sensor kinase CusS [compost metagenome]